MSCHNLRQVAHEQHKEQDYGDSEQDSPAEADSDPPGLLERLSSKQRHQLAVLLDTAMLKVRHGTRIQAQNGNYPEISFKICIKPRSQSVSSQSEPRAMVQIPQTLVRLNKAWLL